jgi:transposase
VNDRERRRFEQVRQDKQLLEQAAAWIRNEGFQGEYAGFHRKELAFGVAALFDMLIMELDRVPAGVRAQAVSSAASIVTAAMTPGGRSGGSAGPLTARADE